MHVLQITDCHIVAEEGAEIYGVDTLRSLRSVLRAASALAQPPNLIVATGDLSEDGSDGSYRRLRDVLLETGLPVYVIPGNHDSVTAMERFLLGGAVQRVRYVDLDPWRIVFLDSKVPNAPYGRLEGAELGFLAQTLNEDLRRPVAICLHHSPTRPCPSTGCHLLNEQEFLHVLDRHPNAHVVLAGHSHLELERAIRHAALLTTPASSAQVWHAPAGAPVDHEDFWASHRYDSSRHGFRMLTLRADGRFDSEVHWVSNERRNTTEARWGRAAEKEDDVDGPGKTVVGQEAGMSGRPAQTPRAKLAVKVVPRASRDEIVGWLGDRLKLKVTAPPQDGRANDALEAFLADALGVPRRSVRVAVGRGSTSKIVELDGLEQAELARRLDALVP